MLDRLLDHGVVAGGSRCGLMVSFGDQGRAHLARTGPSVPLLALKQSTACSLDLQAGVPATRVSSTNADRDRNPVTAQCAIAERPLTIDDLPDLLPAVLEPIYDQVLPDLLGGQPVQLPPQMPTRLPATRARELAEAL